MTKDNQAPGLISELKEYGDDFFSAGKRLFHVTNRTLFDELVKEKGAQYAAEVCGNPVFIGISDWDGDPWNEVSQHAEYQSELFDKFLSVIGRTPSGTRDGFETRVRCALGSFLAKNKYKTVKDAQKAAVDFLLLYLGVEPDYYLQFHLEQLPGQANSCTREESLQVIAVHCECGRTIKVSQNIPSPPTVINSAEDEK